MGRPIDPRSLTSLAKLVNLSPPGLAKAISDGRCPAIPTAGAFDPVTWAQDARREIAANTHPALSHAARQQQNRLPASSQPGDDTPGSHAEASRRLEWAKAHEKELKVALDEGRLLDAEEAKQAWAAMISVAKSRLLGIGPAVGPEVALISDSHDCSIRITVAIRECLKDLSEYRPGRSTPDGGDAGMGPASGADGQPVGG